MPYEVLRTPQVGAALQGMSRRERRSYEAARNALCGEGCRAGGYRLAAVHDRDHNPAAELAEVLHGISIVGRRRSDKPPCCEDSAEPPAMSTELRELLSALF